MVKTKGPLLSLGASGGVGGVLVASNWRGRTYMKKLTIPTNPQSEAQVGVRACLQHITTHWSGNFESSNASWEPVATEHQITNLDASCKINLERWSTGHYPGEDYPVDESDGPVACQTPSCIPYHRGLRVSWTIPPFQAATHAVVYRSMGTAFTPHYTNARSITKCHDPGGYAWIDSPLDPGTYYYRIMVFSRKGVPSAFLAEVNGTVT